MSRLLPRLAVAVVVLGGVIAGVVLFTRGDRARAAEQKPAARPVPVVLSPVDKRDVPIWLEGLGSVAAFQQVAVRPQVDGRLERVLFKEGQPIKKGQVLAQIDPRPFLVQLHQAEGALARDKATRTDAKVNLDRYQALAGQKLVAQQQVDDQAAVAGQSEGAIRMDEAAVENARLQLDYAEIKAPIDGVAGVRLIDAGNVVHANDANNTIVVITALNPAAVYLTTPEDDLPRVTAAMKRGDVVCEVWSRDGLKQIGKGKLAVVDNQINQSTATLRLKALVPNENGALWPNQFVKARLLLDVEKGALVIPAAAVQRGPKGTFAYLVGADQKAESRDIKIAFISGDQAVIADGVKPGDQVVVEGANQLRPGTLVSPRDQPKGKK
jgi:multidrug efflux system membrane fusion protein